MKVGRRTLLECVWYLRSKADYKRPVFSVLSASIPGVKGLAKLWRSSGITTYCVLLEGRYPMKVKKRSPLLEYALHLQKGWCSAMLDYSIRSAGS